MKPKLRKPLLFYTTWILIALVLGLVYTKLLVGDLPSDDSYGGLGVLLRVFYNYSLLYIGLSIGGIIAILFVLLEVLYLCKVLEYSFKNRVFRFGIVVCITLLVGALHYVLEKVIDII